MKGNLSHQLLALEFATTLRTLDAMRWVVVLSSCQQVTVEQLATNIFHRLPAIEFAIALGTRCTQVDCIVVLWDCISTQLTNQQNERTSSLPASVVDSSSHSVHLKR